MRDYGKVHTSFWTSDTIRSLSEDGRMLAFYLLTNPHGTIAGVFRLPDGYVCEDMQWDAERVLKGFTELFAKGFATRCNVTKWVVLHKHYEWNPLENPNQRKSAVKIANSIPTECGWKLEYMRVSADILGLATVTPLKPFQNPLLTLPQSVSGTVTGTVDKNNESDDSSKPDPEKQKEKKAARLPKDWDLTKELEDWTTTERSDLDPDAVLRQFKDYWSAVGGAAGRKLDWPATWRNWVRNTKTPMAGARKSASNEFAGAV